MGIHYDYKSTRGDKAMKKEAKRKARIEQRRAKRANNVSKPEKENEFFEKGIRFGKALQMINILRDIPEDLRFGRCYIPEQELSRHGMKPEDFEDEDK